jgi:N6-adenosine-specific RNA methylase IME4
MTALRTEVRPIARIIVGPRFRRDYRNIDVLAKSIAELGLLQPITITSDLKLITGGRRIKACQQLGWIEIPVHVVDLNEIVRGEFAENTCREDFLPSELAAIGEAVEELERERAKARQGTRTDLVENCHDVDSFGKTRDRVAERLATSGKTYEKIKYVVNAARKDPGRFGKFVDEMDRTGKVNRAYSQVKGQLDNDERAERPVIIPPGRFPTVVCDPPWPLEKLIYEINDDESDLDYPRWAEDEVEERLRDLGAFINDKAAEAAILFLWARICYQRAAEDAVERWGWSRLPSGIWHKSGDPKPMGQPIYNYEPVIIARRGGARWVDEKDFQLCFYGRRREHSRKPVEFYDRVRRVSPEPRLNMFSREEIEGFQRHGNEIEKFDEANREIEDILSVFDEAPE